MNTDELRSLLTRSAAYTGVVPDDIPEINLYIDQILTIFEQRLSETRRTEKDKLLTKSMINNYSKEKLITPIKGKKYSKEQILELMAIFQLKNCLAIDDIKQVMDTLHKDGVSKQALSSSLSRAEGDMPASVITHTMNSITKSLPEEVSTQELLETLLILSKLSFCYKKACENIIDRYFAEK